MQILGKAENLGVGEKRELHGIIFVKLFIENCYNSKQQYKKKLTSGEFSAINKTS